MQRNFTKIFSKDIFIEQFEEYLFHVRLLVALSKTRKFKHMHRISKKDSISLVSKEL